jgi:hypothetical protein
MGPLRWYCGTTHVRLISVHLPFLTFLLGDFLTSLFTRFPVLPLALWRSVLDRGVRPVAVLWLVGTYFGSRLISNLNAWVY